MKNFIQIKKKRLIFRHQARELTQIIHQKIKTKNLKAVNLDFSGVDFISRSFVDEFLNGLNELEKKGAKVKFFNLRPVLQKFIVRVKKVKNKIRKTLNQS